LPMISKVKKISCLMRLVLLLAVFLSFSLPVAAKYPEKPEEGQYQKLIKLYSECIQLEDTVFNKLNFKLSSGQLVKTGSHVKLTLSDNFGRPWIFKPSDPGSSDEYRATVGYRIYKLFGLDTPETHAITLTLNNKPVKGAIQKYVDALPGLSGFREYAQDGPAVQNEITDYKLKLGPEAVSYLLKAQILDWLLKSYDGRFDNFIILSRTEEVVNSLCRVDLEGLLREGNGVYNYDAMIYEARELWFKRDKIAYFWILREYNAGRMNVDWKKNIPFVQFVAGMPDEFLKLQVAPVKTGNLSSSGKSGAQNEKFTEPVIEVKKKLLDDFVGFYERLTGEPGSGGWYTSDSKDYEIRKLCDTFSRQIEALKREKDRSRDLVAQPVKVEARICPEAYRIVYKFRIYRELYPSDKRWKAKFDRAWRSLSKLEKESSSELEKEAIRYYKQQMRIIRIFRSAEVVPTEIDLSLIKNQ
jgi:hypothetical protein